jgi:hypothetical protein
MRRVRTRSLFVGFVGALILSVLTWANWQEPNLHDFVPPATLTILHVGGLTDPVRAAELARRVAVLDGVTTCNLNPETQVAVVMHYPDQTSAADLRRAFSAGGAYAVSDQKMEPSAAPAGPQCPVPAGYVVALERVRFALNFRRFFVKV